MVAEAEVVLCQQSVSVLEGVQCFGNGSNHHRRLVREVEDVVDNPNFNQVRASESVSAELSVSPAELDSDSSLESVIIPFRPSIRSGSFADIGPRRSMEDEHVRIDDLSSHLGPLFQFPNPSAFYGVFDGHGGHEASSFMRKNVMRLFFKENFPHTLRDVDENFSEGIRVLEGCFRRAFLLADQALADDSTVKKSSGTTALTALILGRLLMVANAGDCRAVLSRKGEAIDLSEDHRPIYPPERTRIEESGGFIEDGYLNGVLSVSRALGDWDVKSPYGSSPSPLIAEPECRQMVLTEEDEFLIIACDGIWDVMSSQHAVNIVKRGLSRYDDPDRCARDIVRAALRLHTFDNLTVVVVCFSHPFATPSQLSRAPRLKHCNLSEEAICSLKRWLDSCDGH